MGLVVPFALALLDVYPVIFFVCIIICNLLYVCPIIGFVTVVSQGAANHRIVFDIFGSPLPCEEE